MSADSPSRSPSREAVAPPIRTIGDYLRASARGPFGWIAWAKSLLLVVLGFAGGAMMLAADDQRGLVIGASLMLLGFLGMAAVWILNWVLVAHVTQTEALRALASQLRQGERAEG